MKRLSLLQLIPGMVVAQNVQASNGEMLIPVCSVISDVYSVLLLEPQHRNRIIF